MTPDPELLREILHRALARYLTVHPQGLVIDNSRKPLPVAEARILAYGGARTRYKYRRPVCRSLDAISSITHPDRRCADCQERESCTPQLRLDLILESRPYRLLLAFTSARNFLEYVALLQPKGLALEDSRHRLEVVDRGTWGEIRFDTIS
ncbi:MAG: hypothetical protein AB1486_35520 [Planctomycetota bacterium]